jgi:hypothetical protein
VRTDIFCNSRAIIGLWGNDYNSHAEVSCMGTWGVAKAKAQFSAVLDLAESEGPQLVKRRKQEFYVLTKEQLAEQAGVIGSSPAQPMSGRELWDLLRLPPEDGIDTDFPRPKGNAREVRF